MTKIFVKCEAPKPTHSYVYFHSSETAAEVADGQILFHSDYKYSPTRLPSFSSLFRHMCGSVNHQNAEKAMQELGSQLGAKPCKCHHLGWIVPESIPDGGGECWRCRRRN